MAQHQDGKDAGKIQSITGKQKAKDKGETLTDKDVFDCILAAGYDLKYNEVSSEIECNGYSLTDSIQCQILGRISAIGEEEDNKKLGNPFWIKNAIGSTANYASYNPLIDYIQMAHEKFVKYANEKDPNFSPIRYLRKAIVAKIDDGAIDDGIDWPYECLKYWLCGAVARVQNGFQNWMLVLQGKQGVGKSLLARKLGRVAGSQYFTAGCIEPNNKDHLLKRSSTFVWEVEELDGTMNYADMAHLKAFLTQDSAKERGAYKEYAKSYKAVASFIGTVNTDAFLKDTTGNRRYMCMEVLNMDRDRILVMDMDMVWGEAAYMLRMELHAHSGHIELPKEIKEIQERTNEGSRQISALEIALDDRVKASHKGGVSKEQLRQLLSNLNFPAGLLSVAEQYMVNRGYVNKQVKIEGKNVRAYSCCEITNMGGSTFFSKS
jgi:hypothetical protein